MSKIYRGHSLTRHWKPSTAEVTEAGLPDWTRLPRPPHDRVPKLTGVNEDSEGLFYEEPSGEEDSLGELMFCFGIPYESRDVVLASMEEMYGLLSQKGRVEKPTLTDLANSLDKIETQNPIAGYELIRTGIDDSNPRIGPVLSRVAQHYGVKDTLLSPDLLKPALYVYADALETRTKGMLPHLVAYQ